MKVTATMDASRGDRRLRELGQRLAAHAGDYARLYPSKVIAELTRMRGTRVLLHLPRAEQEELKRQALTKLERARLLADDEQHARVYSAWRYWIYRWVELMWKAVKERSVLGMVTNPNTLRLKRGPARKRVSDRIPGGPGRQHTASPHAGQAVPGGVAKGIPPEAWGIRHRPAWYSVLKRQREAGNEQPRKREGAPLLEFHVGGRRYKK